MPKPTRGNDFARIEHHDDIDYPATIGTNTRAEPTPGPADDAQLHQHIVNRDDGSPPGCPAFVKTFQKPTTTKINHTSPKNIQWVKWRRFRRATARAVSTTCADSPLTSEEIDCTGR